MFKRISIRYKLLITFVVFVFLSLFSYFYLVSNSFKKDKVAYIYEGLLNQTTTLRDQLDGYVDLILKTQSLIVGGFHVNKGNFDSISRSLFQSEKEIEQITVFIKWPHKGLVQAAQLKKTGFTSLPSEQRSQLISALEKTPFLYYFDPLHPEKLIIYSRYNSIENSKQMYVESVLKSDKINNLFIGKKLSFENFLLSPTGRIIMSNSPEWGKSLKSFSRESFFQKVQNSKVNQGVFESQTLNGTQNLISYVKVNGGQYYLVNFFSKDKAFEVLSQLLIQSFLFLLLIVSLAIILSVILSRYLTNPLIKLYEASKEVSEGKLDVFVKVETSDEVGVLTESFNEMLLRIKKLLDELNRYNKELEKMVEEKTIELRKTLALQKTLVNSVDQGFFIVGKTLSILPVFSKATEKIFKKNPSGLKFSQLLGYENKDQEEIDQFFDLVFQGVISVKDGFEFAPKEFHGVDGREHIALNYYEVEGGEESSSESEGIVVVATDKTQEVEAERQLELQRSSYKMILSIQKSKSLFISLLAELNKFINEVEKKKDSNFNYNEIFNQVHTLKGSLSAYYLKNLVEEFHLLEDKLSQKISENINQGDLNFIDFPKIKSKIDEFYKTYGEGLNIYQSESDNLIREISLKELLQFYDELKVKCSLEVAENFRRSFCFEEFGSMVSSFEEIIKIYAEAKGKKIDFSVQGKKLKINSEKYSPLIHSLVHLVRNSIDHGIETPDKRQSEGKLENGNIQIIYTPGLPNRIEVSDDGAGIDPEKIKATLEKKKIPYDPNMTSDELVSFIFNPQFSTRTEVSQESGRGVGMSAVKEEVERVGGAISVKTELHKGTQYTLEF